VYYHIEKILFIKVEVSQKIYDKAIKNKLKEVPLPYTTKWQEDIHRDNKFIRLTTQGAYVDLNIKKIYIDKEIIVQIGSVIDFDRQKMHQYTNLKNGNICTATTVQGAADFFKVNLRHIKKVKP